MPAVRPPAGPRALRMRQSAGRWPVQVAPQSRPLIISGVTRDSSGVVLGGCQVKLFITATDVLKETQVSDAVTGIYQFSSVLDAGTYYVTAYKPGSPDVAGTSVNTIVGA